MKHVDEEFYTRLGKRKKEEKEEERKKVRRDYAAMFIQGFLAKYADEIVYPRTVVSDALELADLLLEESEK